ncbi:hypothetical protein OKA05_27155 [Luteolibacter arcticus]|uniref:Uncharacterized protein n=1 Tax=Luteolibacter arcticus TaxID=1581411 RepID=A0ABT3GRV7_9BACT|nr:hypothetical protein [Luteolibacter arcticus]MCW1926262.1 hypothetical protein [Luteolibacter arcticus]
MKRPVEVTLKYDEGFTVKLSHDEKGLTEVSLTWDGKTLKVPHDQFAEVWNPELGSIQFYETADDDGKKLAVVSFQYGHRPYEWGNDWSKVSFHFIEGRYSSRELSIPAGKDRRTLVR